MHEITELAGVALESMVNTGQVELADNVIMFSGGRDSTLAAIRVAHNLSKVCLVTIVSSHLIGFDRVKRRIEEIETHLPSGSLWLALRQPEELKTDTSFYFQTCLPCHHAYVVAGSAVAGQCKARTLIFGYAGYQSTWPEQTPLAVTAMTNVLASHGIDLKLPVYDLKSREAASSELASLGLSTDALEQKCIRQVTNIELDPSLLKQQVGLWKQAIEKSLIQLNEIEIKIVQAWRVGQRNE